MPAAKPGQQEKEKARRKRELVIILVTLLAVVVITYLETRVVHLVGGQTLQSSILVFALINLNTLLLLLLIFLVFRNLVKLIVERRKGVLGSRLRSKLVWVFGVFSLAPTVLLFFAAFQFVGTSIEFWFSARVERSLYDAVEESDVYLARMSENAVHFAGVIAGDLEAARPTLAPDDPALKNLSESLRKRYDLAGVKVFSKELTPLAAAIQSGTHPDHLQGFHLDLVKRAMTEKKALREVNAAATGDFVAAVSPLLGPGVKGKQAVTGAVAVFKFLPVGSLARSAGIRMGLDGYRQLQAYKQPIKTNQFITLSIVTLLIIFAATWFGFHLAKNITVPLKELAQGTQRVAGGDYDFFIDQEGPDEIGTLVNAFNRMTADLKTSKARLDEAQREMQRTNLELDQRRRYMEIVMRTVAAGVISVDEKGIITTINPSAGRMLKLQTDVALGRKWSQVVEPDVREAIDRLGMGITPGQRSAVSKQVRLKTGGEYLTLMAHMSPLRDEAGKNLGMVTVFEDLTELEKAQRMAAWREVARRIAHEVKNPLTPIKLSAQRLVRRYEKTMEPGDKVFTECTSTIVQQVEELQHLVNEFSTFARLPSSRLAPGSLMEICEEALALYRGAHQDISFELDVESRIPVFDLDSEQMKRVLINLLENAVAAVESVDGSHQVVVRLFFDEILKIIRIEVEDNGPGVPPGDRLRLFEPYFSTKKGGTGLGLSIVSTIVADHNGYIRVQDNQPAGARIIIELPARGLDRGVQEAV